MERRQPPQITWKAVGWPIFWIGTIASLGAFDAWRATKCDGSTLSECTRVVFGVDEPFGRMVFQITLEVGSAALAGHILKKLE